MKFIATLVALSLTLACGPKLPPNTSPEAKVAVRGTQVVGALRAVLPNIKVNTCTALTPPTTVCIKPDDAIKVVQHLDKAVNVAVDLAKVLEAVDKDTSVDGKLEGMARARQLLVDIQNLIMEASSLPLNADSRLAVVGILQSVTAILFSVQ